MTDDSEVKAAVERVAERLNRAVQVESLSAEIAVADLRTILSALASVTRERDDHKRRGDGHWDTLRSIREMAQEGDCERILQWISDASTGYAENTSVTVKAALDRATLAEAQRDEAVGALEWIHSRTGLEISNSVANLVRSTLSRIKSSGGG